MVLFSAIEDTETLPSFQELSCKALKTLASAVTALYFPLNRRYNFFFLSKHAFPTTNSVVWSDTISITLPTTYLHTILQQRWLQQLAFGDSFNGIYPPRDKFDLYVAGFTPSALFWHTLTHWILIPFTVIFAVVKFINLNLALWDGKVILHLVWFSGSLEMHNIY